MPRIHATVAISLHPDLREEARQRAQELGFGNSFSAYVARLIAEDVRKADTLRDAPPYRTQASPATSRAPSEADFAAAEATATALLAKSSGTVTPRKPTKRPVK